MNLLEVGKLLRVIASYDNRALDEQGVTAISWHQLPFMQAVEYKLAEEAVVLFFSELPPEKGPLPYMDPRQLRLFIRRARDRRTIEEARQRARTPQIAAPKGTYAPPENFRAMVREARGHE